MTFQAVGRLNKNDWVTDPTTPDPENLPVPLGWNLIIRPYPVEEKSTSGIILTSESIDFMNGTTNIGRVVAIGPCCWSQSQHKNIKGERFNWVDVGDFVAYPRNCGYKRKFKGVSYIILGDDEVTDFLPDPRVFDETGYKINIPEDHLKKYNTVFNPNFKSKGY